MGYKRFNRHEAFTPEIMSMVSKAIREVEDFAIENNKSMHNEVTNSLFGLYDGYLYDSLIKDAIEFGAPEETINKIKGVVKATEMYISLYDESVTLV
jgi:hypothetical protein